MGAEVERVFSSTGLMVIDLDRQNQLKEGIIEAVECMKSWRTDVIFKETEQVQVMLGQLEAKGIRDKDTDL